MLMGRAWRKAAIGLAALGIISLSPIGALEAATVALPKVSGPKKAGTAAIEAAMKKALASAGHRVVSGKPLAAVAKRTRQPVTSPEVAKIAGADFVLVVTAKKEKKGFTAALTLQAVSDGSTVHEGSESYANAKAAKAAAGRLVVGALQILEKKPPPAPVAEASPPPAPEEDVPIKPSAGRTSTPPAREEEPPEMESSPEPVAEARAEARPSGDERAAPILMLTAGAGSQALSAYAVTVGDTVTGLGYALTPLMLIAGTLRFNVPSTGLGVEADVAFAPAKFALGGVNNPTPDPVEPTGSFLDFGAALLYRLQLTGSGWGDGFALEPLVGFRFSSLSVQEQAPAVVLSASGIGLEFGARPVLAVSRALEVFADLRFRLQLSYTEKPTTTGQDGSGIGLRVGGGARYWIIPKLGLALDVGYAFASVGLKGNGDRQLFQNDAALIDASTKSSSLRASLGAVLAL